MNSFLKIFGLPALFVLIVAASADANPGNIGAAGLGGGTNVNSTTNRDTAVNNQNEASSQANPNSTAVGTVVNQAIQNNTGYSKFGGGLSGFSQCAGDTFNGGATANTFNNFNATFFVSATAQLSNKNCKRFGKLQLKFAKTQLCDYLIDRYFHLNDQFKNGNLAAPPDWNVILSNAAYNAQESFQCALPAGAKQQVIVQEKIIYRDRPVGGAALPPAPPFQQPVPEPVKALW